MADFESVKNSTIGYFKGFNYQNYFKTLTNLLINPKATWETIKLTSSDWKGILLEFVVPSVIITIIAHIISVVLTGTYKFFGFYLVNDLTMIVSFFVLANLIHYISKIKVFEGEVSKETGYQLAGYSLSAAAVLTSALTVITSLIGGLSFILFLIGLYILYVAYVGFDKLTDLKLKIPYIISVVIATSIVMAIVAKITSSIFMPTYTVPDINIEMNKFKSQLEEATKQMNKVN